MTFSTNVSAAMQRLLALSGTMSLTTFTTEAKTIWISSEHFGVANAELELKEMSIRYVPCPGGSFRVSYRADNNTTSGFSVSLDPYSQGQLDAFTLDTDSLESLDKVYTFHEELVGAGKAVEFTITNSSSVDDHILGMEVKAGLHESPAYVGGTA